MGLEHLPVMADQLTTLTIVESPVNLLFGEYHGDLRDRRLQERIIKELGPWAVIYCEFLGDNSITSEEDLAKLGSLTEFHKADLEYVAGMPQDPSARYLLEWFKDYQVPIIGLGDLETQTKFQVKSRLTGKEPSLTIVGRKHLKTLYDALDNVVMVVPSYDSISNVPKEFC